MLKKDIPEYAAQIDEELMKKIADDYDDMMQNKAIIDKYNLNINANQLHLLLPPRSTNIMCPYCNISMVEKRTKYKAHNRVWCPKCNHIEYSSGVIIWDWKCECKNCEDKRKEKKREILKKIDELNESKPEVSIKEVNIEDLVNLFLLYYQGKIKGSSRVSRYELNQIKYFYEKNYIIISKDSDWQDFDLEEGNLYYDSCEIIYELNIKEKFVLDFFNSEIFPIDIFTEQEKSRFFEKKIIEFLMEDVRAKMSERGRDFSPTPKSITRYTEVMRNLSYTQAEYLNYKTVIWAVDWYNVKGYSKKTLEQTILNFICDAAERYKENDWEVYKSNPYYASDRVRCFIEIILQEKLEILNDPINEVF